MSKVCVIGAGPAGCVFAARMAQLGHDVTIVERLAFPRARLGESLSAGVLPLLDVIGVRSTIEAARFPRIHTVTTTWDGEVSERRDPHGSGTLVERGHFDALLLSRASALGARVLQPACLRTRRHESSVWRLDVATPDGLTAVEADFLVDASGRAGALPSRRSRHDVCTIALHAYWRGTHVPEQPRIAAGADSWYWGVPLPDGRYNTLVFLDSSTLRSDRNRSLDALFESHVERSALLAGISNPSLTDRARAIDATPYLDEQCVTASSIKVGDAAMALDPLSSSGVQKAVQSALAGAIVANTLLKKRDNAEPAMAFYRTMLMRAAEKHRGWAAAQYARVAARGGSSFWTARAVGAPRKPATTTLATEPARLFHDAVALSPLVEFVDVPCIDGEFVTARQALAHPALEEPVAFVGRWEITSLLRDLRTGMTPLDIARSWNAGMPLDSAVAIAGWLLKHGLLVPVAHAMTQRDRTRSRQDRNDLSD